MDSISPEVAQKIMNLRASPEVQARVALLAERANLGSLSVEEQAEYMQLVDAFDRIAILQSKARKILLDREL